MLVIVLLALGTGVLAAAALFVGSLWSAIPRSNADFEWRDA